MRVAHYVDSAPAELVELYETKAIAQGRRILGLLLTVPDMELVWQELEKHVKAEDHAIRLFDEIRSIWLTAKKNAPRPRSKENEHYRDIAKASRKLQKLLEKSPQNKRVHEYFPPEVMQNNDILNWEAMNTVERVSAASTLLRSWPLTSGVLNELANAGQHKADFCWL